MNFTGFGTLLCCQYSPRVASLFNHAHEFFCPWCVSCPYVALILLHLEAACNRNVLSTRLRRPVDVENCNLSTRISFCV
jgi:thiol-disulfide isomerase/thioredoxin